MQRISFLAIFLALLAGPGCAAARVPNAQSQDKQSTEKKDKEKKKKKKKKTQSTEAAPGAEESPEAVARDRRAISRVLRDLGDGFEGKSARRVAENINDEKFDDFPRFEDLVTQFLQSSGEMRVFFREASGEVKGDRATLIVDAEMVYSLKSNPTREQRRKERVQFDFIRSKKGWKIYEITPRQFFGP